MKQYQLGKNPQKHLQSFNTNLAVGETGHCRRYREEKEAVISFPLTTHQ
jgi:hypothetical protein